MGGDVPEARLIYWMADVLTPVIRPLVLRYWPHWLILLGLLGIPIFLLGQGQASADRVDRLEGQLNSHVRESSERLGDLTARTSHNTLRIGELRGTIEAQEQRNTDNFRYLINLMIALGIINVAGTGAVLVRQHNVITQVRQGNGNPHPSK